MKIAIYPCEYFKGIYCPFPGSGEKFHCSQTIKDCNYWRKENFPKIQKTVERETAIAKHKLKEISKIVLDLINSKNNTQTFIK